MKTKNEKHVELSQETMELIERIQSVDHPVEITSVDRKGQVEMFEFRDLKNDLGAVAVVNRILGTVEFTTQKILDIENNIKVDVKNFNELDIDLSLNCKVDDYAKVLDYVNSLNIPDKREGNFFEYNDNRYELRQKEGTTFRQHFGGDKFLDRESKFDMEVFNKIDPLIGMDPKAVIRGCQSKFETIAIIEESFKNHAKSTFSTGIFACEQGAFILNAVTNSMKKDYDKENVLKVEDSQFMVHKLKEGVDLERLQSFGDIKPSDIEKPIFDWKDRIEYIEKKPMEVEDNRDHFEREDDTIENAEY